MTSPNATPDTSPQAPLRIRLTGTPANVRLAIVRLGQCFSTVTDISHEYPCRDNADHVNVYVKAAF